MRLRAGLLMLMVLGACVAAPVASAAKSAPVRHVFVIMLENEAGATTFGPSSPAPYLARTLTAAGAFVPGYYGIGHNSLDNYIAMISGQSPNVITQADCPVLMNVTPGTPASAGQVLGQGSRTRRASRRSPTSCKPRA